MKFIIEENCHNIKVLDAISPYIKIFLDELLKKRINFFGLFCYCRFRRRKI